MPLPQLPRLSLGLVVVALGTAALSACSSAGSDAPAQEAESTATSEDELRSDPCRVSKRLQNEALWGKAYAYSHDRDSDYDGYDDPARHGHGDEDFDFDPHTFVRGVLGRLAFSDRHLNRLNGNGRACADCHSVADDFTLKPESVEARYEAWQACKARKQNWDDPLFRPIDADDFRTNGENANQYTLIRKGLVRVSFTLPAHLRLVDTATGLVSNETTFDVWRAVPSIKDVALTGADGALPNGPAPNSTGGYQLDARFSTLQEQARGALLDHAQVTREPSADLLENLTVFQKTVFSSSRTKALARALEEGLPPPANMDPPLDALETQGKAIFTRACGHCHGNDGSRPTTATPLATIRRFSDAQARCPRNPGFTACPPHLTAMARTFEYTNPITGVKSRFAAADPGRALITNAPGQFTVFDIPNLRGLSKTAPYFHDNSALTLEDVIRQYREMFAFFKTRLTPASATFNEISTDGINVDRPFTPAEEPALLAYLKKI